MSRHALLRFRRTLFRDHLAPQLSCIAYKMQAAVFNWAQNNLKKIRAHRIKVAAVEQALSREPVLIYGQDRETERNRLRADETRHEAQGNHVSWSAARKDSDVMKKQNKVPKFLNEDEEAAWWVSAEGRVFLKQQSAAGTLEKQKGSPLVANLSRTSSVQICPRLTSPKPARSLTVRGSANKRF